ncbi:hypothetical protein MWU52_07430 [Jannaschia sp. S6380]|uniref:hypothetical protein n=1 Tax=Jannaschia sp. S6380 TaxID=2926408 RepID=UPI001FF55CC7|nr:hypothetical protein [Jannaschia sp. S6380]MCK0167376.1 hypothetical protein [Jannaschia sp. S6380]
MRNPLVDRKGPPLSLGVRAARWGAAAFLIGAVILAVPIVQGYREGPGFPVLDPSPWEALKQMGREMAMQE